MLTVLFSEWLKFLLFLVPKFSMTIITHRCLARHLLWLLMLWSFSSEKKMKFYTFCCWWCPLKGRLYNNHPCSHRDQVLPLPAPHPKWEAWAAPEIQCWCRRLVRRKKQLSSLHCTDAHPCIRTEAVRGRALDLARLTMFKRMERNEEVSKQKWTWPVSPPFIFQSLWLCPKCIISMNVCIRLSS